MQTLKTDLCVIGAGSAGLSVAAGAAQMGASVVLVEKGEMGGDCLNHGCVPSKALIAAAHRAHEMTQGAPFGIAPEVPRVDYAAVMDHVAETIARIAPMDSQQRFEGFGINVIRAHARFVSPREIDAGGTRIAARRFVVATGSSPMVPPIPGLADVPYLTNESLWSLRQRPEHLLVIGGGPIGLEMAQAHRRLGSAVTVIEAGRALGREDPEMAAIVLERLHAEGVRILENTTVGAVRPGIQVQAGDETLHGSHLLVAAGRKPNTDGLGLDVAGVETSPYGVQVDGGLRTTNRRIYAIGDIAGGGFTHVAGYHAGLVVRSALFALPAKARPQILPRATYTAPELAQVGLTEAEALAKHGDRLEVYRLPHDHNDRAVAQRATQGLLKLMVVRGRPVGVSIAGAQAGELIGTWALALSAGLKLGALAGAVMPYPTVGELNKRLAGTYFTPRLFENETVKKVTGLVQRWLP
ncbi:dihydrolipoyl dehydrogenase family protein [Salipiger aestuarii]|uniref:Pyruvate/2-oxoglutarate dehydrogenase complex dihydrolipoamide dehydrogenase (E3) component n=1 Tax=Salipiger aestuarii TaxID=568098 RepID=A0A327XVR3_9RHOB|nr:FAD-dependent oxidoreductase [Salipiger aestuarii]KAA8609175.1 dihydrolipoamide dehydrogenase [Salipiger aestuarii]KAB2540871.1 dihydrolipoamide dehydrogenase [Salipiger aestuarii]RAK12422.1 pyruvate/2-oxoglutarate dehydrogenase complex dihydrolipoamide dehydrogenase (E3) component [Salipiger aestuarii]